MTQNKNMAHKNKRGFTLIELLVVIAVIGLLATIVMVSVNSARVKARNAKIRGDIKQIILAMEMYYDSNNHYPYSDNTWRCLKSNGTCWRGSYSGDADIINDLAPYLSSVPQPPVKADTNCYAYDSYLYHGSSVSIDTYPAGAYIVWTKEGSALTGSECPGHNAGTYDCGYYYCYQFIGPNN